MRDWLIAIRTEKGMTQKAVAEYVGISAPSYNTIESSKTAPSVPTAQKLGKLLDFPWTRFFDDSEPEEKATGGENVSIGERIKERRKELGMSQDELGRFAGYTDRSSLSKIEDGLVDLPVSKLFAIATALGVSAAELLGEGCDSTAEEEPASEVDMSIGERIRERREELGMTQEELAYQLHYKGRSSINKIELGHLRLQPEKIKAIADALNTTTDYIMGWNEVPTKEPEGKEEAAREGGEVTITIRGNAEALAALLRALIGEVRE